MLDCICLSYGLPGCFGSGKYQHRKMAAWLLGLMAVTLQLHVLCVTRVPHVPHVPHVPRVWETGQTGHRGGQGGDTSRQERTYALDGLSSPFHATPTLAAATTMQIRTHSPHPQSTEQTIR